MSDAKPPELRVLVNELVDVRRKWYDIGIQLNIPDEILDDINSACKDNYSLALRRLMQYWLRQIEPRATWADLVEALRARAVNEQDLAKNLEERFVPRTSTRNPSDSPDGAVSSTSQALSVVRYTPRPAQAARKLLICLLQYFLAYVTSLSPVNNVVLMELDEVSDPEVQREIQHLHESFENLRMDVYSYLEKEKPNLKEFRVFVSSPAPSWKTKRPQRVTDVDLDRIMNPDTEFYQMFCIISQYTNWYNYELLKKIINRYGNPDLKRKMEEYCKEITDFEGHTSAEVLKNIRFCEPQPDSVSIIAMLPDHHCNQFTMSDIRKLKHAKADEAGIDRAAPRLHMVHKSSVKIIFLVPIALAPYLMVSSVSPLLTSPNPLPENMYERCVQYLDTEEVFRLMGVSSSGMTNIHDTI